MIVFQQSKIEKMELGWNDNVEKGFLIKTETR
jgi:hypothetical protein